jgi:hypothetical protein
VTQRTAIGLGIGKADGSGTTASYASIMAQGTFDITCLADAGETYNLNTGNGAEAGTDYAVTKSGVAVDGSGSTVTGFTALASSVGTVQFTATSSGATGNSSGPPYLGNNNQAVLIPSAGAFGAGTVTDMTTLRKTVTVTPGTNATGFTLGAGYLTRTDPTSDSGYLIILVTNNTGQSRCIIGISNLTLKNGAGTTTSTTATGLITGSGPSSTVSCLANGEAGYIVGNSIPYAATAEVVVNFSASVFTTTGSTAKVIPQRFIQYDDGEPRLEIKNTAAAGNANVTGGFTRYVLLDAGDLPVWWGFLVTNLDRIVSSNHIIAPASGATLTYVVPITFYGGSAAKMVGFTAFTDTATAPARAVLPAPEEEAAVQLIQSQEAVLWQNAQEDLAWQAMANGAEQLSSSLLGSVPAR